MFEKFKAKRALKKVKRMLFCNIENMLFEISRSCNEDVIEACALDILKHFEDKVKFEVTDNDIMIIDPRYENCRLTIGDEKSHKFTSSVFTNVDAAYCIRHYARLINVYEELCMKAIWLTLLRETKEVKTKN